MFGLLRSGSARPTNILRTFFCTKLSREIYLKLKCFLLLTLPHSHRTGCVWAVVAAIVWLKSNLFLGLHFLAPRGLTGDRRLAALGRLRHRFSHSTNVTYAHTCSYALRRLACLLCFFIRLCRLYLSCVLFTP